ncbi:MAG: diacylglycerol kinase family lipid kinase [Verrucomicrobia bacterium]|nr:diacylglycerol kinase family lipid kinase [Verrucomicrobiota bacterium]
MRIKRIILLNPRARSEKAAAWMKRLQCLAPDIEVCVTEGGEATTAQTAEAVRKGNDVVVAAGGDGTINEVINGIAGTGAALGILPMGSVNVLARQLGIPLEIRRAWDLIELGHARAVDLIRVEHRGDPQPRTRYFVQVAGAGVDAHIVQRVTWRQKRRWGPWSYLIETLKAVGQTFPRVRVQMDDADPVEGAFVLMGNGSFYGGPVPVFHRASMSDGLVDVCVFDSARVPDLLRYGLAVIRGRQSCTRGMVYRQAKAVEITASGEVPIEMDGEFAGYLPAQITVVPAALRVLVPAPPSRPDD